MALPAQAYKDRQFLAVIGDEVGFFLSLPFCSAGGLRRLWEFVDMGELGSEGLDEMSWDGTTMGLELGIQGMAVGLRGIWANKHPFPVGLSDGHPPRRRRGKSVSLLSLYLFLECSTQ